MAATFAIDQASLASRSTLTPFDQDPFLSALDRTTHDSFSNMDTQSFPLGAAVGPDHARRTLEAHLAETERRIQDASTLGTMLVQQRKDLADRLRDVEKQQSHEEISPELRQKLVDIEKEYNEVGKETARAFQPRSRVLSNEMGTSPFGDTKRSVSPSKFESQGTSSPSKLSVPSSRRSRNQPSNRVHDIEFVTEISKSLIAQVRHLQTLLAEKEDTLKAITLEKSRLEIEAEGLTERLRSLDESEHRYKDENWNLETQIHEFLAAAKEAADRERKLTHSLNVSQVEKSAAQKELDEIKSNHTRLTEDHAAALKHHEIELGGVKRNMTTAESERSALQHKIEELTDQNRELARAVALQRGRLEDQEQSKGPSDEDFETAHDDLTPEHSPPPSPVKGTPRHSMLESETLKSSLHHAHRMIQNLKGNIHREKTEKLELKRMLQDARDELDARRGDFGSSNGKRTRKAESKEFKKPLKPGQLGGLRSSRSEVFVDDPNWEEDVEQTSISHPAAVAAHIAMGAAAGGIASSALAHKADTNSESANEHEPSDAFETANERATETEDFQTGHEEMSGSDELTEIEGGTTSRAQGRPAPVALSLPGNRQSFQSTASTSDDEYDYTDPKTPTAQSHPHRLRLKVGRGGHRHSRGVSEEPQFQSSPASFANSSRNGTPNAAGQSLFAEVGDMGASDDESVMDTPNRSRVASQTSTPASRPSTAKNTSAPITPLPPVPKIPMIDSGMMTEPWEPKELVPSYPASSLGAAGFAGGAFTQAVHLIHDKHSSTGSQINTTASEGVKQWQEQPIHNNLKVLSSESSRPISTSTYSDMSSQYDPEVMDEKLAKFPEPPTARVQALAPKAPLTMSTILSEHVEPEEQVTPNSPATTNPLPVTPMASTASLPLMFSTIHTVDTEPLEPRVFRRDDDVLPQRRLGEGMPTKAHHPESSKNNNFLASVLGWSKPKETHGPVIAEDETRQSPNSSPKNLTSESKQPFKELSSNPHDRSPSRRRADEGAQTALTGIQIDEMLKAKQQEPDITENDYKWSSPHRAVVNASSLRTKRSQESIGSVSRARAMMANPDHANDTIISKRPGSASSRNNSISSIHPPLPNDHKKVIAAAAQRSGSSAGGIGSMGPPSIPASAYRANPSFRPKTPNTQPFTSSVSARGPTTPRQLHPSGNLEVQSPTRTGKSRASSISSFASEVDARFNRTGITMPHGLESSTDPRMINAITQTMIGEYLWKYTRKAGRGAMSENRHRRYFWVHPYTRTLYWSDRDPSSAGRAELKAKSVPIEAVRVVTDDNPMPPGLHRKSLVIITPGRAVKFTATTGQRHEIWFNALSYLLLRTGEDAIEDSAEVANGSLTQEDVAEFNPGHANSMTLRKPASVSSYSSHVGHDETGRPLRAPVASHSSRTGTFSRLSNYWKPSKEARIGSLSSRQSRHSMSNNGSMYEASEAHDSAEDVRQIIEKQDRDSDKLENVRACCDGKHDVGHLHSHSTRSRHGQIITGSLSGRPSQSRTASRTSVNRRTE